jgi:Tol biopolymer transport system component
MKKPLRLRLVTILIATASLLSLGADTIGFSQGRGKKDGPAEPYRITPLSRGLGLTQLGPRSPDGSSVLLLARKPDQLANLHRMSLVDFSITPALTTVRGGVADPSWSADSKMVAFSGTEGASSLPDIFVLELRTGSLRRLTANGFADRKPVFTPDGTAVLYATDESPLAEAAFGILHVAIVRLSGGKGEYFTEDETSADQPQRIPGTNDVSLIKIEEMSGRHSLWRYTAAGRGLRDLTESRFNRILSYEFLADLSGVVLWAQEAVEQRDDVFIWSLSGGGASKLPDNGGWKRSPALSPDGRRVCFVSPTEVGSQLFLYDRTTGLTSQLTARGTATITPVLIDNDRVIFGSDRTGTMEVYLLEIGVPAAQEKKK